MSTDETVPRKTPSAEDQRAGNLPAIRVLVVSPPKTGNVWVEKLIAVAYGLEWVRFAPPCDYWGDGADTAGLREWLHDAMPARAVVHQHYRPGRELFALAAAYNLHLVTTIRDPYDQLVSLYFYVQQFPGQYEAAGDPARAMIGRPIDHEAVVRFAAGPFGRYLEPGAAWVESGRSALVRYEDLSSRPLATMVELARHLGPVGERALRAAVGAANADRMRAEGADLAAHIRAATVGDWRNHLTGVHLTVLRQHDRLIRRLGYEVR